jgi:hypothetical protein
MITWADFAVKPQKRRLVSGDLCRVGDEIGFLGEELESVNKIRILRRLNYEREIV